jgi:hypothetical protein
MTEAWRIDSLDARGGLAFASFREADLLLEQIDLDQPAVFLSAPAFEPEPLTSRALAFGAARAQAQLGVYTRPDEGGAPAELAFSDLNALREFVRRVYLASGGGDAGGGGGGGDDGGPPPPSPAGEGPRAAPDGEHIDIERKARHEERGGGIGRAADEMHSIAMRLRLVVGDIAPTVAFSALAVAGAADPSDAERMVDGATELVLEMVSRYPAGGSDDQKGRWARAARRLGRAITRMDFWLDILDGPQASKLDGIAGWMLGEASQGEFRWFLPLFFGTSPTSNLVAPWLYHEYRWRLSQLEDEHGLVFPPYRDIPDQITITDPVDDLCAWPMPDLLTSFIGSKADAPSVFHLLSTCIADPARLRDTKHRPEAERAIGIVLFAAAHLQAGDQIPSRRGEIFPDGDLEGRAHIAFLARSWLVRQMPSLVFPIDVEELIGQAAEF